MCNKEGHLRLIDLGWAVHRDDAPYVNHPTRAKAFAKLESVSKRTTLSYWGAAHRAHTHEPVSLWQRNRILGGVVNAMDC